MSKNRLEDPAYREALIRKSKKHTITELLKIFNTTYYAIACDLEELDIEAKQAYVNLDPDIDLIQALINDHMDNKTLASKFDVTYSQMYSFIKRNRLKPHLPPGLEGTPSMSVYKAFRTKELPPVIRLSKTPQRHVLITQDAYLALWEKAHA